MPRKQSVTTRIHQPPAPPFWFKTIFWLSFLAWIGLQSAAEFYTAELLQTYTHLPLFDSEQQVDSAFLNIIATGLLTLFLVVCFMFGIVAVSKVTVISSAAFLATLLILNILAVGVLMSSRFSLAIGPKKMGHRVMTIYHWNVSEHHWRGEMGDWAARYPLPPSANASISTHFHPEGITEAPSPHRRRRRSSNETEQSGGGGSGATNASAAATSRAAWQAERETMPLLSFFQWWGFCCGLHSVRDYAALDAQTPPSCRCFEKPFRPHCSADAHLLADGNVTAVWARGCLHVTGDFKTKLLVLRDILAATIVVQFVVMMLGVVMGLNMPDSPSDDDASEGGDY